jgi:hypothetical protein
VLGLIGSRCPAAALSDVLRNRLGGATKLIGQVRVPLGQPFAYAMCQGKEFDRALVYVEPLEVEHARAIGRSDPPVALSLTASITPTVSFRFTSAATITGTITITITITATAMAIGRGDR